VHIGAYTPHALPTPADGHGLERDVARTREALGMPAAHPAIAAEASDPAAAEDHDAGIATPLAYTAAGRIREGSVRPRISIVV
jgi:hypothetical protein